MKTKENIIAETKSDWISVKDALPTESGLYLVLDKNLIQNPHSCGRDIAIWWPDKGWASSFFRRRLDAPLGSRPGITHWMPFPEMPQEEE
jgi:hypothetical protein